MRHGIVFRTGKNDDANASPVGDFPGTARRSWGQSICHSEAGTEGLSPADGLSGRLCQRHAAGAQNVEKLLAILVVVENGGAINSPEHHMVNPGTAFLSGMTRHCHHLFQKKGLM